MSRRAENTFTLGNNVWLFAQDRVDISEMCLVASSSYSDELKSQTGASWQQLRDGHGYVSLLLLILSLCSLSRRLGGGGGRRKPVRMGYWKGKKRTVSQTRIASYMSYTCEISAVVPPTTTKHYPCWNTPWWLNPDVFSLTTSYSCVIQVELTAPQ